MVDALPANCQKSVPEFNVSKVFRFSGFQRGFSKMDLFILQVIVISAAFGSFFTMIVAIA